MSPDHWSKLTWDSISAGGYDLFDPIGYLDRKRDRAYKQRVIVTPARVIALICFISNLLFVFSEYHHVYDQYNCKLNKWVTNSEEHLMAATPPPPEKNHTRTEMSVCPLPCY